MLDIEIDVEHVNIVVLSRSIGIINQYGLRRQNSAGKHMSVLFCL
jgi:hypothetical protein